ncbi:MAG: protoporphyrinogen oxidase [Phycisphaerae bacterium]
MASDAWDVIVVGGGISGLTTAWYLQRGGAEVCLLEASNTVGGCTQTKQRDGFLLEKGPFNVMVRDPAFEELLLALSGKLSVVPASRTARSRYIYRRGRLYKVPSNPISLATSGLLSVGARARLFAGLLASRRAQEAEETIERAALRRFGREVTETMISSVIAGIFAGDIGLLSLRACFPSVADVDRQARSLLAYALTVPLRAKRGRARHRRRWRGLVSLDGGLGALTRVMGEELGNRVITRCAVDSILPGGRGYQLTIRSGGDARNELQCRELVIATPASEAGRLLEPITPDAARELHGINSSCIVTLNLGFKRDDIGHPLEGFGFLVPRDEHQFPLMGVLWADSMFPHHAPADHRLIRVFIGGVRDPEATSRTDDELLTLVMRSLRPLLQIRGEPVLVDPCRYQAAIPQYHLGHAERIVRVREAVAARPGLHLAGNYLQGVSLNDCVRFAKQLADSIGSTPHGARTPSTASSSRHKTGAGSSVASTPTAATQ